MWAQTSCGVGAAGAGLRAMAAAPGIGVVIASAIAEDRRPLGHEGGDAFLEVVRSAEGALHVGLGRATLTMTVRDDMLNGHDICHGGFITLLADSAFAFACNARNVVTVAAGLTVDFLAPAHGGDVLTAVAQETSRAGRTGVYDMVVTNQQGTRVALVRGRSHSLNRSVLPAKESA